MELLCLISEKRRFSQISKNPTRLKNLPEKMSSSYKVVPLTSKETNRCVRGLENIVLVEKSLSYEVVPMTSKETYPSVRASVLVVLVAWLAMY